MGQYNSTGDKIINFLNRLRFISLRDLSIFLYKILFSYRRLYNKHHFAVWHATAGIYELCPYKKTVLKILNAFNFNVVVEMGCGLGDIIRRLDAPIRIGIDTDRNVISAAKFLDKNNEVTFLHGSFTELKKIDMHDIDCLILIYFLHLLSAEEIKTKVAELSRYKNIRYLIVDEIIPGRLKGFKYRIHNFSKIFSGLFEDEATYPSPEKDRNIKVFRQCAKA